MDIRKKNVDIIRAMALLLVVVYHAWVLSGSHEIPFFPLKLLVSLGGEIGVTIFFLISGFGLFYSLDRKEQNYFCFMKRRFVRIAPEYYVFLMFLLFFTPSVGYISFAGMKDVLLHLLFLHNITPQTSGTINGVLWTMAVTVQFYLIAKPMYKCIRKFPVVTLLVGVLFTVSFKYVCFHYLMNHFYVDQPFWYSRNIFF
nr:acyltransferase [Lachnospiraceae bacterium]